ncbi:PAS domain S-box protein [Sphingomonas parva]|uniref:histidine kinase n=1 Tax=Sphingomonas parva TaxID=2555898 RepID=A0A4Y8ZKM2_9SPHN|nr:MEDS domain-containing protein [Sphingomonas parva]TFI56551.1 PAS domain S-box protein [Sphingomonas parva]
MATRNADTRAPSEVAGTTDSGIPVIGPVLWGTHCCLFFETVEDYLAVVARYFSAALENGQYCLWILSGRLSPDEAQAAMERLVPAAKEAFARGAIEIARAVDLGFRERPFPRDALFRTFEQKLEQALAQGFEGMRVAGEVASMMHDDLAALSDLECTINRKLQDSKVVMLCCYCLGSASGGQVFRFASSHEFAVGRCHGEWQVMEVSQAVGAGAQIKRLNLDLTRRIGQRTRQLQTVNDALVDSEELFRFIAENMTDVIALYDTEGRTIYVSPSAPLKGRSIQDMLQEAVRPEDRPWLQRCWERAVSGEQVTMTLRYLHPEGSWHWLESTAVPVHYRGRPHVLSVSRDVSARRALEEQLQHAQKMEALGRLAGGVAHDFNNVLTAIFGFAAVLRRQVAPDSNAQEAIEEIRNSAERARKLTRQLLTFARRDVQEPQMIDAAAVIREVEGMLRLVVREEVAFSVELPVEPLPITIDPVSLEQVLMNLVVNASDATPPGGRIVVRCDRLEAAAGAIGTPAFVEAGAYVRIEVADTGSGLLPEVAERAFEPFFTTKTAGQGTGLGLSTVFGIVKQAGGYVWIDSEPEQGTRVSIVFPAADQSPA